MRNLLNLIALVLFVALVAITPVMAQTANQLPCVIATTDRSSFTPNEPVTVYVSLSGWAYCKSRQLAVIDQYGGLGQKLGFALSMLRTEKAFGVSPVPVPVPVPLLPISIPDKGLVIGPFQPPDRDVWQQIEFRAGSVSGPCCERQIGTTFTGLQPGKYLVTLTVTDEAGYDFLMGIRFSIQGVQRWFVGGGGDIIINDPEASVEAQPEPNVYLRPGFTQVDKNRTFSFGSELGAKTGTGFLYQLDGNTVNLLPTEFVTVGKMGDLSLVKATVPLPTRTNTTVPMNGDVPVYTCVKPDGGISYVCGSIYDPAFPNSSWGGYSDKW